MKKKSYTTSIIHYFDITTKGIWLLHLGCIFSYIWNLLLNPDPTPRLYLEAKMSTISHGFNGEMFELYLKCLEGV